MIIIFNFLISIILCKDGYFEDINGTTRIYHGVNLLHYPITNINENDFDALSKVGFNLIRLAIYFDLASPTKPKSNQLEFNITYLDSIQQIVKNAAKYQIDVILVANQKYLNKQFCGFGFPDWIVKKLTFPNPYLKYENKTQIEICNNPDVQFYRTEDVGINFENLYKNINNSTDYFGQFWQKIASIFKDEINILGYDLLNNPQCGNHQVLINNCLWPGYSNRKLIMPFYQKINNYIRQIDDKKIIFYQSQDNDIFGSGFDDNISGNIYRNNECYSFKIQYTAEYFIQFASFMNYYSIYLDYSIGKHAQVSNFLSEFEGNNEYLLNSILQEADYLRMSWTYKGNIQQILKQKILHRAYAQKICAENVLNHEYNGQLGVFKLQYISKSGCQTIIFIPFPFEYQCTNCQIKFISNYIYEVKHSSKQIQLIVWHKQ